MEDLQELREGLNEYREKLNEYENKIEELEQEKTQEPEEVEAPSIDQEQVIDDEWNHFAKRPYLLEQEKDGVYHLHVPSFIDFQVGRFLGTTNEGRFRTFLLDNTTKMLSEVPEQVKQDPRIDLSFEQKFEVKGNYLHYRNDEDREFLENHDQVRQHLEDIMPRKAKIKPGHEFELMKDLFALGFDPFTPEPVDDSDLIDRHADFDFELYDYQKGWIEEFMSNGRAAFCGPTGSGKTAPAIEIMAQLDGPKAVIVSGRMTKGQWKERIKTYCNCDAGKDDDISEHENCLAEEIQVETYDSIDKLQPESDEFEYSIVVADECHALPADTFAGAALLPTKYRLGLSATPYREDDRTPFIFALTGSPTGMDWDHILEQQGKERHEVNIHIVEEASDKLEKAESLYDSSYKTLLYTDHLDIGEDLSENMDLEFVSGQDGDDQYDKATEALEKNNAVIISRVGDQGFSPPGLEAIIEVDFLFGSRRQQLQRTGRLLHDDQGDHHDIIFTEEEWRKHKKRVASLVNRDWELNFADGQDRELELPDDHQTDIDLDTSDIDRVDDEETSESRERNLEGMETFDFLKKDAVQEKVESRAEDSQTSEENCKKALTLIAQEEDGLSTDDLMEMMDLGQRTVQYATAPFRNKQPKILVQRGDGKYVIDTDVFEDILEAQRKREQADEVYEDVWD